MDRLDKWARVGFKDFAETQGRRASRGHGACKAQRENAGRKALKELWDCAATPAHRGRKAKFPKAL